MFSHFPHYKEKKSVMGKGVSAIILLDGASVPTQKDLKTWPEFVSIPMQMSFAKAEVYQFIILTQIWNLQSFFLIIWYSLLYLFPSDHALVPQFWEGHQWWRLNQHCSLQKFQILSYWSQRLTTKWCHCCCCFCIPHPNWNPHYHCFCWQAHPIIQKHIWLSWHLAGAQGQSSSNKMTWWDESVQQKIFLVFIYYSDQFACLVGEAAQEKCYLYLWQIPWPGQK